MTSAFHGSPKKEGWGQSKKERLGGRWEIDNAKAGAFSKHVQAREYGEEVRARASGERRRDTMAMT
jgi:hypothetical protein